MSPRFVPLAPEWAESLGEMLTQIRLAGEEPLFHPHPLTPEAAAQRAAHRGLDRYYVALAGERVVAYGMLRGWDEGYEVPSLGIAVHPEWRKGGLGRAFMCFLHEEASRAGASRIRLKVHRENAPAKTLYQKLGYAFEDVPGDELVGYLALEQKPPREPVSP